MNKKTNKCVTTEHRTQDSGHRAQGSGKKGYLAKKIKLVAMVFWVGIFSLPVLARSERPDLNDDFNDAQRMEMCELLDEWMTSWLIDMHGNDFAKMHTGNDFLRWHRDHFKHLEAFLIHEGHPEYVPFPKWDPSKPVPSYFNGFEGDGVTPYNNISSKCLGGTANGCRPRENYKDAGTGALNFKFNQSGVFDGNFTGFPQDNLPMPTFYDINGTLCSFSAWSNLTSYSNHQQVNYHNAGHISFDKNFPATVFNHLSVMGSGFGQAPDGSTANRAAAAFIFWPWHAHIDDMWWNWDRCKKVNTVAYTYGTGLTIPSGTTITWNNPNVPIKIQGNLEIQEDATLIIKDGQIVEMLDEYFTDQACDIIVHNGSSGKSGGRLIIESGAILRGVVSLGATNGSRSRTREVIGIDANGNSIFRPIYPDGRVYYLCKWSGIKVYGDPTKSTQATEHGKVLVDGTASEVLFQYAKSAIESIEGGVIQCTNATFRNCDNAINIHSYTDPNPTQELESFITDCTFEQLDQISRYFTEDNMYMHDLHDFHHLEMIKLLDVEGLHIAGCEFINSDPNIFEYENRGVGIASLNSKIYLHKSGIQSTDPNTKCPTFNGQACSFTGLSYGVAADFYSPISQYIDGYIAIDEVQFTDCWQSVYANRQERIAIYNCKFNYDVNNSLFPAATATNPQKFVTLVNNWYNIVHGAATLTNPNDPLSPKIFQSVFTTNSPVATLVEIDGGSLKSLNNKVMQNEFVNTSPSPLSYGLLLKNDNFNSTITCNRFQGLNGAIYNLGKLRNQEGREQGNDFADPIGTPEQHIRTDGTPLTSFRYETASTLDVSNNITVTPPTGSEEPICNLNCESDIAAVRDVAQLKDAKIYPNPTNGKFTVELDVKQKLSNVSIAIIDNLGRVVQTITPNSYTQEFRLSSESGVYYVVVYESGSVMSRAKLLKYD